MKNILVMLMLIPLWLLIGCEPANKPVSGGSDRAIYLTTHKHDGHSFVCASSPSGGPTVIHHPGCECLKSEGRK